MTGMRTARRRDRMVYLAAHPVLFILLAALRRFPVLRLGRVVIVNGTGAFTEVLTTAPLDRTAPGTTGGAGRELLTGGVMFDQDGAGHRDARRSIAGDLGTSGVTQLRPVWTEVLRSRLAPLATGDSVDMVEVAAALAGSTACALLGLDADPVVVAQAAREAAAAAAKDHLPRPRLRHQGEAARHAMARLNALLAPSPLPGALAATLTIAAVNTTVAGLPRAVAWCADARLWADAADQRRREVLVAELLRVVAPSPLLPRAAAADTTVDERRVRAGDRLILLARHAALAHRADPDCRQPVPAHVSQLVFGAGPHACPGAKLARAQLDDTLAMLAPHRPVVVRARPDRHAALPSWASLVIRTGDIR